MLAGTTIHMVPILTLIMLNQPHKLEAYGAHYLQWAARSVQILTKSVPFL